MCVSNKKRLYDCYVQLQNFELMKFLTHKLSLHLTKTTAATPV